MTVIINVMLKLRKVKFRKAHIQIFCFHLQTHTYRPTNIHEHQTALTTSAQRTPDDPGVVAQLSAERFTEGHRSRSFTEAT